MGRLSFGDSIWKANSFRNAIQDMEESARSNFEDMDFENADKRTEMEELKIAITSACSSVEAQLDSLWFE